MKSNSNSEIYCSAEVFKVCIALTTYVYNRLHIVELKLLIHVCYFMSMVVVC